MKKPKIELYCFGHSRIVYNGEDITSKLSTKSVGILFYIAVEDYISREKLAYLFWEDSEAESAKYNLRYNIWCINKLFKSNDFNEPLIVSEPNRTFLSSSYDVYFDAEEFNNDAERMDDLIKNKALYHGDFLEGFYIKNSYQYNDWLFYKRETYQKNYVKSLNQLLSIYKSNDDYSNGCQLLEEMIRLNPLDEDSYNALIEMYIESGDRHSALKQYNRCIHMLREELNLSPKESTLKLLSRIKASSKVVQNNEKHLNAISFRCHHDSYHYYSLHLLVDGLLKAFEVINCDSGEIGRIHNRLPSSIKTLTPETERLLIYQSVVELIDSINDEIHIRIEDLHLMDQYSYEGIKFLLMKKPQNVKFEYTCDDYSKYHREIERIICNN